MECEACGNTMYRPGRDGEKILICGCAERQRLMGREMGKRNTLKEIMFKEALAECDAEAIAAINKALRITESPSIQEVMPATPIEDLDDATREEVLKSGWPGAGWDPQTEIVESPPPSAGEETMTLKDWMESGRLLCMPMTEHATTDFETGVMTRLPGVPVSEGVRRDIAAVAAVTQKCMDATIKEAFASSTSPAPGSLSPDGLPFKDYGLDPVTTHPIAPGDPKMPDEIPPWYTHALDADGKPTGDILVPRTLCAPLDIGDGAVILEPKEPEKFMLEFFAYETIGGGPDEPGLEDRMRRVIATADGSSVPYAANGCRGGMHIEVLPELVGLPYNHFVYEYLAALRPSEIVTIRPGMAIQLMCAPRWQVAIYLGADSRIEKITQAVDVGGMSGDFASRMLTSLKTGEELRCSSGAIGHTAALARVDFQ